MGWGCEICSIWNFELVVLSVNSFLLCLQCSCSLSCFLLFWMSSNLRKKILCMSSQRSLSYVLSTMYLKAFCDKNKCLQFTISFLLLTNWQKSNWGFWNHMLYVVLDNNKKNVTMLEAHNTQVWSEWIISC